MKDKRSLHLKVQEHCDCFATTDPLREMSLLPSEGDVEDGALKWMSLAVLHGINANAKKIALTKTADGNIKVVAKYRKAELPSPGAPVGKMVFDVIRGITHIEGEKGTMPLAVGVRDSSLEVLVRLEHDGDEETVTLEFPK